MTNSNPSSRSDEDTYEIIDQALLDLATRRAAWLGDGLTTISLLTSLIDQAQRCLPLHVHEARENGHSWQDIAHALATSPEQAQLWFDPDSPVADGR